MSVTSSFRDEANTRGAAAEIEQANYDVTVTLPHDKIDEWTVVAESYRVIAADAVAGFEPGSTARR